MTAALLCCCAAAAGAGTTDGDDAAAAAGTTDGDAAAAAAAAAELPGPCCRLRARLPAFPLADAVVAAGLSERCRKLAGLGFERPFRLPAEFVAS